MTKMNEKSIYLIMLLLTKIPRLCNYNFTTFHILVVNTWSLNRDCYFWWKLHETAVPEHIGLKWTQAEKNYEERNTINVGVTQ